MKHVAKVSGRLGSYQVKLLLFSYTIPSCLAALCSGAQPTGCRHKRHKFLIFYCRCYPFLLFLLCEKKKKKNKKELKRRYTGRWVPLIFQVHRCHLRCLVAGRLAYIAPAYQRREHSRWLWIRSKWMASDTERNVGKQQKQTWLITSDRVFVIISTEKPL